MAALAGSPTLCDLNFAERASLVNWPLAGLACGDRFLFLPLVTR
jgi:hypothetical protein